MEQLRRWDKDTLVQRLLWNAHSLLFFKAVRLRSLI